MGMVYTYSKEDLINQQKSIVDNILRRFKEELELDLENIDLLESSAVTNVYKSGLITSELILMNVCKEAIKDITNNYDKDHLTEIMNNDKATLLKNAGE